MKLGAQVGIDGVDEVEEEGVKMFSGGESRRDWGFGQEVED